MAAKKKTEPKKQDSTPSDAITLVGMFARATTTVDGGWNVTFAMNQDEVQNIAKLSEFKDWMLQLAIIPVV